MSTGTAVAVEEEKTIEEFLAKSEAKETESTAPTEDTKPAPSELSQEKQKDTPAKENSQEKTTDTNEFEFNADYYKDMDKDQLLEQIKRQEGKVHKAHKANGRLGQQLGDSKKELESISKDKELLQKQADFSDEEYNDLVDENPAAAARRSNEANNAQRQIHELDKREQELKIREFIQEKVPDYSDYQTQINEIIKTDMDHFGREPTEVEGRIYNFAKRAKLEKSNTELQAQVKELNSKLESQPKNILNQISEAAKTPSFGVDSGYSQSTTTNQKDLSGNYAEAREAGIELIPD